MKKIIVLIGIMVNVTLLNAQKSYHVSYNKSQDSYKFFENKLIQGKTEKVELKNKFPKLKENDIWIDIASNDGTLLSFLPESLIRIGIDPADDSYKVEAEKHSNLIIQDYFSSELFKESKYGKNKAKVITCIAMFYDI